MKNAPDDYAAEARRLKERLDWLQLARNSGKSSFDDFDELAQEVTNFVVRWGERLRAAEDGRTLQDFAAALRRGVVANELVHRHDVLLALASRRDVLHAEKEFAITRGMFRALDAMPGDERSNAEALLGPREDALDRGHRAVEEATARLEAHLAKMRGAWADCANGDFARRVLTANDATLVAWMAEVSAEVERLRASPDSSEKLFNASSD